MNLNLRQMVDELGLMRARSMDLTRVMKAGGVMGVSEIQERFDQGRSVAGASWMPLKFPRPDGGNKPLLRQGLLRASFTSEVSGDQGKVLRIGTARIDAPAHQFGATITPKRGKYLAIPVSVRAQRSGGPRSFGEQLRPKFVTGAGLFLVAADQTPHFRLARKVKIPARPFMGFSEQWISDFSEMLTRFLATGRL